MKKAINYLLRGLYVGVNNLGYLYKSTYKFRTKLRIFITWIRFNLKFVFLSKLFKLKTERFLGYKVEGFNYKTLRDLFEEIFYRNEYYFKPDIKKPVIFDCGANIGFATLLFKRLCPESVIYAFEPDKETFKLLEKNVKRNKLKNVHLFNSAIAQKNGTISFFIDSDNPGSLLMSTDKQRMAKKKVTVNAVTLSSIIKEHKIKKIDFMKMDIEGSEKDAILDLDKNRLMKKVDKFVIEYHHKIGNRKSNLSEFLQLFEKHKFEYQIDATSIPVNAEGSFQDVLLYLYK